MPLDLHDPENAYSCQRSLGKECLKCKIEGKKETGKWKGRKGGLLVKDKVCP